MAICVLTLEDEPDGQVSMQVAFRDGYQSTSHAHGQMARLIMDVDAHAETKTPVALPADAEHGIVVAG
jgi:hypothetical protein